jgi:hypothetical protein
MAVEEAKAARKTSPERRAASEAAQAKLRLSHDVVLEAEEEAGGVGASVSGGTEEDDTVVSDADDVDADVPMSLTPGSGALTPDSTEAARAAAKDLTAAALERVLAAGGDRAEQEDEFEIDDSSQPTNGEAPAEIVVAAPAEPRHINAMVAAKWVGAAAAASLNAEEAAAMAAEVAATNEFKAAAALAEQEEEEDAAAAAAELDAAPVSPMAARPPSPPPPLPVIPRACRISDVENEPEAVHPEEVSRMIAAEAAAVAAASEGRCRLNR